MAASQLCPPQSARPHGRLETSHPERISQGKSLRGFVAYPGFLKEELRVLQELNFFRADFNGLTRFQVRDLLFQLLASNSNLSSCKP